MSWFKKKGAHHAAQAAAGAGSPSTPTTGILYPNASVDSVQNFQTLFQPPPSPSLNISKSDPGLALPLPPSPLLPASPTHSFRQDDLGTGFRAAAFLSIKLPVDGELDASPDFHSAIVPSGVPCEAAFQNQPHACTAESGLVEITDPRASCSPHLHSYRQVGQVSALCPSKYLELCRTSLESTGKHVPPLPSIQDSGLESLSHLLLYSTEELEKLDQMSRSAVERRISLPPPEEYHDTKHLVSDPDRLRAFKAAEILSWFLFNNIHQPQISTWTLVWFFPTLLEGVDDFSVPTFLSGCENMQQLACAIIMAADNLLSDSYPGSDPITRAGDDRTSNDSSGSTQTQNSEAPSNKIPLNSHDIESDLWLLIVDIYVQALEHFVENHSDTSPNRGVSNASLEDLETILITLSVCIQRFMVTRGIMVGALGALRLRLDPRYGTADAVPLLTLTRAISLVQSPTALSAGCFVLTFLLDVETLWESKRLPPVLLTDRRTGVVESQRSNEIISPVKALGVSDQAVLPFSRLKDSVYDLLYPSGRWRPLGALIVVPLLRVFVASVMANVVDCDVGLDLLEKISDYTYVMFSDPSRRAGVGGVDFVPLPVLRSIAGAFEEIRRRWPKDARRQHMPRIQEVLEMLRSGLESGVLGGGDADPDIPPRPRTRPRESIAALSPRITVTSAAVGSPSTTPRRRLGKVPTPSRMVAERSLRDWAVEFRALLGDGDGPTLFSGAGKGARSVLPLDLGDEDVDGLVDGLLKESEVVLGGPAARVAVARHQAAGGWKEEDRWELLEESVVSLSRLVLNKVYGQ
ncbi:hypothetical protein HDU97_002356 [Phlyctochytrium planicorne]|nr:hypothetical protein HDU97_002356 [Phlyctochytrium planicorne]